MLGSLLSRQDDYLNVKVGQKFSLQTTPDFVGKDALITRRSLPKPASVIRRVGLDEDNIPRLKFDDTDVAVIFDVEFPGDALRWKFSPQRDPEESSLLPLSKDQFDQLASVANVIHWKPDVTIGQELKKDNPGTELWLPLAFLALALATTETMLAHWFSRSK